MKKQLQGFTLIEMIIFIIITSILMKGILLATSIAMKGTPFAHQNLISQNLAQQCMEGFIGERRQLGYNHAKLVAASPVTGGNMPSTCTSGNGFTVSASIVATTLNTDSAYKTIQVSITGSDIMTLNTIIADY
jgi:Tfp pilus assembly protein PilE